MSTLNAQGDMDYKSLITSLSSMVAGNPLPALADLLGSGINFINPVEMPDFEKPRTMLTTNEINRNASQAKQMFTPKYRQLGYSAMQARNNVGRTNAYSGVSGGALSAQYGAVNANEAQNRNALMSGEMESLQGMNNDLLSMINQRIDANNMQKSMDYQQDLGQRQSFLDMISAGGMLGGIAYDKGLFGLNGSSNKVANEVIESSGNIKPLSVPLFNYSLPNFVFKPDTLFDIDLSYSDIYKNTYENMLDGGENMEFEGEYHTKNGEYYKYLSNNREKIGRGY
jgi:hypothetical protein